MLRVSGAEGGGEGGDVRRTERKCGQTGKRGCVGMREVLDSSLRSATVLIVKSQLSDLVAMVCDV